MADEGDLRTYIYKIYKYVMYNVNLHIYNIIYREIIRPHLEYAIPANCPYLIKDIYHLESIQRVTVRWVQGLRDLYYKDRLKELKLQSLE